MHVRPQAPDIKPLYKALAIFVGVLAVVLCVHFSIPSVLPQRDVIYGRRYGTALTMDVYRPLLRNGAGIIWVVSGGWYSDHNFFAETALKPFLQRGYTVFAVSHSSTPKFTMIEASEDIARANRYIRHNAASFGIDGNKLGVIGISSGGHLSLFMATHAQPGNLQSTDPVDREPTKVNAVVAFAPPCDFLNYGQPGANAFKTRLKIIPQAAAFQDWDSKSDSYVAASDDRKTQILGYMSPINGITPIAAPALIFHGDRDRIVPFEQSVAFITKLKQTKVPAELVVQNGADHDFNGGISTHLPRAAEWFDKYLLHRRR